MLNGVGLVPLKDAAKAFKSVKNTGKISNTIKVVKVSLDNNVLIAAVEGGEKLAVKAAIGGAQAIVSTQAVKEFLIRGSKQGLKNFMIEVGATVSKHGGTTSQVEGLQNQAFSMDRNLKNADARVATDAINNNAMLITRDKKLRNFMNKLGHSSKGF